MRNVLVILPLYRNAGLIPDLFRSLISAADDFGRIGGRLLIIVDSPDDENLTDMLRLEMPALEAVVPTELHVNARNLGFVGSVNFGFERAIAERRDAIALNSDVIVTAGAFAEMQAVAYLDHMTGFVSPRSNNATLCSLPNDRRYRHRSVEDSLASFEILSCYLPRYRYVPTAVGFCLYIKWTMLTEFGLFDPIYGRGYNEENDLILRANQCGYRAMLANHAFVFHIGEQSFSLTSDPMSKSDLINGEILRGRYPEYDRSIAREAASPEVCTESVLTGLLPDSNGRLTIAFDWTNIGLYHNGTFEAAKEIVRAAARNWRDDYDIVLLGTPQAVAFHGLDRVEGVRRVDAEHAGIYAAIVRIGQPFDPSVVDYLSRHTPVLAIYMLDTIALDCQYLDAPGLQAVWQYSLDGTELVAYISEYTQTQFRSRFRIAPHTVEVASLLSLDPAEYRNGQEPQASDGDSILVVGNHFAHKYVDPTVALLASRSKDEKIVVLGGSDVTFPNVVIHKSGSLSEAEVDKLYSDARVILFPSHYEGFGFPIMHAIGRKRPVIVRKMPLYDEFQSALQGTVNLHQCETTQEMVELALSPQLRWKEEPSFDGNGQGWERVASDLKGGLTKALERVSYDRLVPKFEGIVRREQMRNAASHAAAAGHGTRRMLGLAVPLSAVARIGSAIMAVALLATLVVLVYSAFLGFRGYSALPFWDQWQYVRPEVIVARMFHFHNEHRAIVSKLLFLIDARLFDSRNIMLFAVIYLIQGLHCVVLIRLALACGIVGRVRRFLVPAVAISALFATQNYENLTWGFQTQFVLVFAMASASFACFAIFIDRGRRAWLFASVAAAMVASLEMANGIAVLPLLLLFALYYRLSWKVLLILGVALAVVGSTYAFGRMQFQSDPTAVRSNLLLAVQYVLVYLGGFLGETLTSGSLGRALGIHGTQATIGVSMAFGLVLVASWATFLVLFIGRSLRVRPELVAIFCVFGFVAASAFATAFGRAGLGLGTALAGRYVAGSSLAAVTTVFMVLWVLSRRGRPLLQAAVLSAVVLMLVLIALAQPDFVSIADNRRIARDFATTALYAGATDEDALRNVFVDTKLVAGEARYLQANAKSIFADGRSALLGRKFTGPVADCAVTVNPQGASAAALHRIDGILELNPFRPRPLTILVIDPQDSIVGIAVTSLQNDQTRLVRFNRVRQTIPWQGHLVPGAQGPFRAVLPAKAPVCAQYGSG